MKKFLLLLLIIIPFLLSAQSTTKLNVKESTPYTDNTKTLNILGIHTSTEGKTVILRTAKKEFILDVFDRELNRKFFIKIKKDKKEIPMGGLFFEDKAKTFSVYAPNKKERILYSYTFNLDNQNYEKKELFKTTIEKRQSLFSSRKNHQTSFRLSDNNKYFAIATDNVTRDKNSYTIRVFDSETENLVYEKSYQESSDKRFEFNDMRIENDGTVYILGKQLLTDSKNFINYRDTEYKFVLNKISKEAINEVSVEIDNEHIQSLNIFKNKGEFHLLGFYSETFDGRVKGGCDFVIDEELFLVKSKKTNVLPKQVYEDLYGYRKATRKNKKKKELKNFDINYVLTDDNGANYLIAEEFYITQTYVSTGNGTGYWQTIYHYDDILILKFSPTGELIWGRSIFKRATSPSYNAFLKDNQLHIILNSGKNLTTKTDGRVKVKKSFFESSALYDIEFTESGEVSYNKIQDNSNKQYYIPFYGTYEQNRFIMMSNSKYKRSFMILE